MENKPKRPPSVWISQIFLMIFALIFLLPVVLILLMVVVMPILAFLIVLVFNIGIATLFLTAFWGLVKRRVYGRWMTVTLLSLMLVVSTLAQFFKPSGPLGYYEYKNSVQVMGGACAQLFMIGLFVYLIYSLAFGSAANAFFAKPDTTE